MAYAFPDAKGFGGSTTTAAVARKVFTSSNMRERLVKLTPELYRPAMRKILLNELILLRLMSCDYKLLPDKIGLEETKIFLICIVLYRRALQGTDAPASPRYWGLDLLS